MLKREKLFAAIVLSGSALVLGCTATGLTPPDLSGADANPDLGSLADLTSRDLNRDLTGDCDAYVSGGSPVTSCDMSTQYCECGACGCFEFPIIL